MLTTFFYLINCQIPEAKYQDSKVNNNTAEAEILIAISPGIFENYITYIIIAIIVLSTAVVIMIKYNKKEQQKLDSK